MREDHMKMFVAAVPLFDASMTVGAYRLRDKTGGEELDSDNNLQSPGEALQSPGLKLVKEIGTEPFAGDKPLLIDISAPQLLAGIPREMMLDPERIVCLLPGDLPARETEIAAACAVLLEAGFALAMDGMPQGGADNPLAAKLEYLILDCSDPQFVARRNGAQKWLPQAKLVVSGIPNQEAFNTFAQNYGALFSGSFYNLPVTKGAEEISPIKVNALQLLRQVSEEDFELIDIAKVVERDPALSVSLLRFINSAAVGLKHRVSSITTAVATLGQREVRRWAIVAISVSLAEDRPGEVTKLSLVRAKFAENLARPFGLEVFRSQLFMAGLFSLLDVFLQKPMEEAAKEIVMDDKVRGALVQKRGVLYPVMELIYTYERADWEKTTALVERAGVEVEAVTGAFVDALVWYEQLLRSIDEEEQQRRVFSQERDRGGGPGRRPRSPWK